MLNLILNLCNQIVRSGQDFGVVSLGFALRRIGIGFFLLALFTLPFGASHTSLWQLIAGPGVDLFRIGKCLIIGFFVFKLLNSFIQCFRIQSCEELMANRLKESELETMLETYDPLIFLKAKSMFPKRPK